MKGSNAVFLCSSLVSIYAAYWQMLGHTPHASARLQHASVILFAAFYCLLAWRSNKTHCTSIMAAAARPARPVLTSSHITAIVALASVLLVMFANKLFSGATRLFSRSSASTLETFVPSTTFGFIDDGSDDIPARFNPPSTISPSKSVMPSATRSPGVSKAPATQFTTSKRIPTGYKILRRYTHDVNAFTQGVMWHGPIMYESYGIYGKSGIRKLKYVPAAEENAIGSYEILTDTKIDPAYFGEGMTIFRDRAYMLTWQEQKCFVFDPETLQEVSRFNYLTTDSALRHNEGWGLTHNTEHLIVSDGTENLIFWQATESGYEEVRRVAVTRTTSTGMQQAVEALNELEYIHGWVFANVWFSNEVQIIDPASGVVVGTLDFTALKREARGEVLNGLAYTMRRHPSDDADADAVGTSVWDGRLWVTGKNWNLMFELELTDFVDAARRLKPAAKRAAAAASKR